MFVNLYPGRVLEPAQVAGVVHLVASSVPQLSPDLVSIVDQSGKLLTQKSDPLRAAGLDPTQLKIRGRTREELQRAHQHDPSAAGRGRQFPRPGDRGWDFDQTEQTAETYKPNPTPEQAIRSQQTAETQSRDAGAQGVPGALTNQPPVPATAPITNPAVAGAAGANGQLPLNSTRNATTNYELDKTVAHVRRALGQVKRLSVAVVVNHRTSTQANGRTETTPLTDQEIERITNLVKEAVGYARPAATPSTWPAAPSPRSSRPTSRRCRCGRTRRISRWRKKGSNTRCCSVVAFVAFG